MLDRMFPHGIEHYLTGGLLIGAGVALLFVAAGLVGGMSSFFPAVLSWGVPGPAFPRAPLLSSRARRVAYALRLLARPALFLPPGGAPTPTPGPPWRAPLRRLPGRLRAPARGA